MFSGKPGARSKSSAKSSAAVQSTSPSTSLARQLFAEWADPAAEEALARAIAAAQDDAYDAIAELVAWGARTHADSPDVLWTTHMRSPLRVALHLVARAGLDPERHDALFDLLWDYAGSAALSRRALAHDVNAPPAILSRVVADRFATAAFVR